MAAFADLATGLETADPFGDLVAELTDFQRGVSRPGRLSLVGTMLQDSTDAGVRARYQAQVIAPRRRRLGLHPRASPPAGPDRRRRRPRGGPHDVHRILVRPRPGRRRAPRRTGRGGALPWVWRAIGGTPPADALPGRTVGE